MAKTIVGAGVFGFPLAYAKTGFVTVTIMVVILATLIHWTVKTLLQSAIKVNETSYHGLMRRCFGQVGFVFYSIFSFLFAFGGMCAYTVIIGDSIPLVLLALFGPANGAPLTGIVKYITDRRIVIIFVSYFILLPVSSFRYMGRLGKLSFIGLSCILLITLIVIIAGVTNPGPEAVRNPKITVFEPTGILSAIGTLCFAYVCHHATFKIYGSLKKGGFEAYRKVSMYSLGFACTMSLVIGISGFLIFSTNIKSGNILNLFDSSNPLITIGRALFAIDIILTYPLELFIARNTLFEVVFPGKIAQLSDTVLMGFTIALVTATTTIGVSTCNIGSILDITGGLAASAIAFIFPSACWLKVQGEPIFQAKNISHIVCITVGCIVLLLTTVSSVEEFIHAKSSACKSINF
ncbi:transmembrane amino acid transporter protein-domain-containing protein [Globomyces pollinis-pini]|nr:transmembrane amino acid transporter protein-domain-containing protein [Globomyces pollinis-pini]